MQFRDQLVRIPEDSMMRFARWGGGTGLYLHVNYTWKNYKGEQQIIRYGAVVVPSMADDFARLFTHGSNLYISGFDSPYVDKNTGEKKVIYVITGYNICKKGYFGDD